MSLIAADMAQPMQPNDDALMQDGDDHAQQEQQQQQHVAASSSAASAAAASAEDASAFAATAAAASAAAPPAPIPDPELVARVHAYRQSCLHILAQYQTHHLIPHSGKVVIFDSQLVVKHAFDAMVHHDLSCAPVWDSWKKKYVGLLSVSDFLDILMSTYAAEDKSMFDNLSNARICDWAAYKKQRGTSINRLLCISPEATLHEAVRQLLNYRVHRLCVVQLALADTVLRIITNHGILRFLRNNSPTSLTQNVTVRQLGIGVYHNLLTLTYATPVIKALELLSAYKVSSIPIVDDAMRPIDVYTRADVRYLALDQTWTNLEMTIEDALSKHRRGRALGLCSRDDTIHTVSGLLVSSMRHSLICVKPDGTIEGVVSLTDIFSFLLNSNAPAAESRIAALMKDYAQYEAQEAQRMQAETSAASAANLSTGQQDGPYSSPRVSHSIRAEERLRQAQFLSDHGQGAGDDAAMLEDPTSVISGDVISVHHYGTVEEVAQAQGVSPEAIAHAIAAGTSSALPHPELLRPGAQQRYGTAAADVPQQMASPGIRPSKPTDGVPPAVDFLG